MTALFVSDIHLSEHHPEITNAFWHFLDTQASDAEDLFILGDLFDAWAGDDIHHPLADAFIKRMRCRHQKGFRTYFIRGNRDFLIGHRFAQSAYMRLLPDPCRFVINDTPVLLTHGDRYCLDDKPYLRFRRFAQNPFVKTAYLSLSSDFRMRIVRRLQKDSRQHLCPSSTLDLDARSVETLLSDYDCQYLIHGHTHHAKIHRHHHGLRYTLGDWTRTGGVVLKISSKDRFSLSAWNLAV